MSFFLDVDVELVRFEISEKEQPVSVEFDLRDPEQREQLWNIISHIQPQLELYKE
jgi:hypothetical protein